MEKMQRSYLTLEQVSERMHIRTGTARNRLSRGEPMPPSVKVGRRRLFPAAEFELWMTSYLAADGEDIPGARPVADAEADVPAPR